MRRALYAGIRYRNRRLATLHGEEPDYEQEELDKLFKACNHEERLCDPVFPRSGCNPKLDLFDCLKACAERAELDKQDFWLHKFRSTFATRYLWAGVDFRTVQQRLGHADMESMR